MQKAPEGHRSKKDVTVKQDTMFTAQSIAQDFSDFVGGFRVLFLIWRNKEGGEANNTKVTKIIVNGEKEYVEALYLLLLEKEGSSLPLRIYASVNERDFGKAIRQLKFEMLEADYYAQEHKEGFYTDIHNRFVGCLMSPNSAKDKKFILDIDSNDEMNIALSEIAHAGLNDNIIKQYKTKNGWHIVMRPFKPDLLATLSTKLNKDGLILLSY